MPRPLPQLLTEMLDLFTPYAGRGNPHADALVGLLDYIASDIVVSPVPDSPGDATATDQAPAPAAGDVPPPQVPGA